MLKPSLPPASLGLQARGGIQWGQLGQDVDYTVWADSGPSFESSPGVDVIPAPVIGEALNPLTGTNIATNGKGFGGTLQVVSNTDRVRTWGRLGADGDNLQRQVAGLALVQFLGTWATPIASDRSAPEANGRRPTVKCPVSQVRLRILAAVDMRTGRGGMRWLVISSMEFRILTLVTGWSRGSTRLNSWCATPA